MHLDQDADHGDWLEEALVGYCDTEEARAQVRRGALLSLNAREKFWWGVLDKVNTELTKLAFPGMTSAVLDSGPPQPTFNQIRQQLHIHISLGH
jgi:hypothetical protein